MNFNIDTARRIGLEFCKNIENEVGLDESFANICLFLSENPERQSSRSRIKPSVNNEEGLKKLAQTYFKSFRKSDLPSKAKTVPDLMVRVIMKIVHGYSDDQVILIEKRHQESMCAENCVGALLERYLDSVLRSHGWHWCCGSLVKSIDFIQKESHQWRLLQIKNRDNSENSSSSAIRTGTTIQKWHRSFSKTGKTNWDNLPETMQGYDLNEKGFVHFVERYLKQELGKGN